ncbi:hypothetical protein KAT55_06630 [Candidatus Bathyarchaeota archaeon]|nr:hypothetical protein [Candidatus Bathyarchaeota archaeon]
MNPSLLSQSSVDCATQGVEFFRTLFIIGVHLHGSELRHSRIDLTVARRVLNLFTSRPPSGHPRR